MVKSIASRDESSQFGIDLIGGHFLAGHTGLNALLHVARQFEHARPDTLVTFPIIKKLNHVIYLPVVILFHGLIGVHVLPHVSLASKNVHMDGHAITKQMLLNVDHAMPEPVFTPIGLHGTLAHKLVLAVLK